MSTLNIQLLCRKSRKKSLNNRYLLPDLARCLTLSGSNYPCLKQFSMVPKMFEPLKFDCISLFTGRSAYTEQHSLLLQMSKFIIFINFNVPHFPSAKPSSFSSNSNPTGSP